MDSTSDPDQLDFKKKEMLKNGYMEVIVEEPVDGLKKDDVVLVLTKEFGQLGDDASVKVLRDTKDEEGIFIPVKNLKIKE